MILRATESVCSRLKLLFHWRNIGRVPGVTWMSRHERRHLPLVEHRIDDTSRRCGLAAEQILAAALGWIMRHDAIVKATRLAHQRIDVLGQQKT
jgi:hypothetical protein